MRPPLGVVDLGRMDYASAHAVQRALCERRITGLLDRDLLLLVEHESTVTLGRGTRSESLPLAPEDLRRRGLTVVEVERGGDVTWHGPGQLVGYPILDLETHRPDLHWYLRQVEEALIRGLARLGIPADRNPGLTGVWTEDRKIASIGIHVRRWITTHGFALNVWNDLSGFGLIVPCGIAGVKMTSVAREADWRRGPGGLPRAGSRDALPRVLDRGQEDSGPGAPELWRATMAAVVDEFGQVFDRHPEPATLATFLPQGTESAGKAL
jgi:lipoyl(octanoyl) transferase